jgi:hypothetical protein
MLRVGVPVGADPGEEAFSRVLFSVLEHLDEQLLALGPTGIGQQADQAHTVYPGGRINPCPLGESRSQIAQGNKTAVDSGGYPGGEDQEGDSNALVVKTVLVPPSVLAPG